MRLALFAILIALLVLLFCVARADGAPRAGDAASSSDYALSSTTLAAAGSDYPCGCTTRYHYRWFLRWTRTYGRAVGRWADDAARAGWQNYQMPTLGRIIRTESGGSARAYNPSGCAGLLQLAPFWYRSVWYFDPFNPRLNLRYGRSIWRRSGWGAWCTY